MTRNQSGNIITKQIRRDTDGTYSANVWFGGGGNVVTNVRRNYGYLTRAAAQASDISETVEQTNRRVCER